jgi:hypothetical protein
VTLWVKHTSQVGLVWAAALAASDFQAVSSMPYIP